MAGASIDRLRTRISRREAIAAALAAGALITTTLITSANQQPGTHETPAAQEKYKYPEHTNIPTTVFWAGEEADVSNGNIPNTASAWEGNWNKSFGGVDDPNKRCGYDPCGFQPKENTFYFALPFGDYTDTGPKPPAELKVIPWYTGPLEDGKSYLKNRWIKIIFDSKEAYAQWEDVGPVNDNDAKYVFGTARPKNAQSGLDVSPAVGDFLGLDGKGDTSWRFVDEADVPDGPWKKIITRSDPNWNN